MISYRHNGVMDMSAALTPGAYYRLPWTLTDNAISWLEITDDCNLACEGCYRPRKQNHKSLEQIANELALFSKQRKSDCMSLAGGDPLVHPEIVQIVKMVKSAGWKPIINTNGLALGRKLLHKLKEAGAHGFTFHIDTTQVRSDSRAQTEKDLNSLRLKFAEMLAAEGGLTCSFNQTVSTQTLEQVRDTLEWAQQHPDIVHTMVFILFRTPYFSEAFDFYANGKPVNIGATYEKPDWGGRQPLAAKDVVAKIREADPDYRPCACLSGDADPESTKWLLACRLTSKKRGFGYLGPKSMEAIQASHHFFKGTWLSYTSPGSNRSGRTLMSLCALFDRQVRSTARHYLASCVKNPLNIFDTVYMQSFMIIQPIDILPDGQANMCDGCPDMTMHEGKLRWSCRLEEVRQHGCMLQACPKNAAQASVDFRPM